MLNLMLLLLVYMRPMLWPNLHAYAGEVGLTDLCFNPEVNAINQSEGYHGAFIPSEIGCSVS